MLHRYNEEMRRSTPADPQGFQGRQASFEHLQRNSDSRHIQRSASDTRPPLSGSRRAQREPDLLYNSFASTPTRGTPSRRADPPSVSSREQHKSRRVLFSKILEIHEKQLPQTPSTPTIPILRSGAKRTKPVNSPSKNSVELASRARDPTPRSNINPKRRTERTSAKKKTIADILNEQSSRSAPQQTMSDPPLDRSRRPHFSPATPKSPRDIFSKLERRHKSEDRHEKAKRQSIEPEPRVNPPTDLILQMPSQNHWDMTELFPTEPDPISPLGMHSIGGVRESIAIHTKIGTSDTYQNSKTQALPQNDWDPPKSNPDTWNQYYHKSSPSNSSTESDAYLIKKQDNNSTVEDYQHDNGDKYERFLPKRLKKVARTPDSGSHADSRTIISGQHASLQKNSTSSQYVEMDSQDQGTELVLIPREGDITHMDGGGSCLPIPQTPKSKQKGFGSLLKRAVSGPPKAQFQELPVLAMSFEDSVDLKKGTESTGESHSANLSTKLDKWDNFDRESQKSEDDEFLIPGRRGKLRREWKVVVMLVCLVATCLGVGLPLYFKLTDTSEERGNFEVSFPPTPSPTECFEGTIGEANFTSRYTEIRKVVLSLAEGNSTKVDEPWSAQRKALCWISDLDQRGLEITSSTISDLIQRYSLAVLYFSLVLENEPDERSLGNSDFLSASHECEWSNIMCGNPETVTALLLADKLLTGTLPSEIANLASLSFLELSSNQLTGRIPTSIAKLRSLEYFAVAFNSFSGFIPSEIGLLTKLEFINMRSSQVHGTIPKELGQLGKLETLLLEGNWLSGTIPSNLGNLVNAQQMSFRKNYLTGKVSAELCELRDIALTELEVDSWIGCNCCTS